MNRYVIIRSDTKSISSPMSRQEAIKKLREYGKEGISSYLVYKDKYVDYNFNNQSNVYYL